MFVLTRGAEVGTFDLGVIYFTTALPFLGSGIIVSLVIAETIERVDRIYFFDLLGAAGGCLALVLLLNTFGGPNTVIAVSVLFAVGGRDLVQLAGMQAGPHRQRLRRPAVHDAGDREHEVSLRRSPLRQRPEAAHGAVHEVEQHFAHRHGRRHDGGEMIYHRRRRFHRHREFRLQPPLGRRSRLSAASGPEHPLQSAARRENAGDRAGRRLGCFARAGLGQPRCYRRRNQSDHRHRHHAEAVSAAEPGALSAARRAHPYRRRPQFRAPQPRRNIR